MKKGMTLAAVALLSVSFALGVANNVVALSLQDVFSGSFRGQGQPAELFGTSEAIIPRVINLMLFIIGILAIFMIIYGGIRYVLSGGDNTKVKDAKNTILYAIVGLVVALLGYAIVNWIVSVISGGPASTGGVPVSFFLSPLLLG